jgi:hypothetical protein
MVSAAAFAVFCLVCAVLAFTRHPIWGVYFYLATTYIYPPGRWWGYLFGDLRWALLSAAITALAVVFHRGKLKAKPMWLTHAPVLILTMYAVWMWVQLPWAADTDDHLRGSTEFVKFLLALWFVYRACDSVERVRDLSFAHVLGCCLLGMYAYFTGRDGDRLDGVGGPNLDDSNTLGMVLVTGVMCGIGLVLSQQGWRRWLSLACLPIIANGFVLANSRGAFLGFVAGAIVLYLTVARRHRGAMWAFAAVGVIGLAVIVDRVFIERMFTISDVTSQDESADASARSRVVIAKAQLQMFLDHPLGSGWRGTAALSPQYMEQRWLTGDEDAAQRSSHNTYLTALAEQGVPGALLYLALLVWVAGAIFRVRRLGLTEDQQLVTLGASLVSAIVVVLTAGTTADYLTKEVQFWLYAGLVSVFTIAQARRQTVLPREGVLARPRPPVARTKIP